MDVQCAGVHETSKSIEPLKASIGGTNVLQRTLSSPFIDSRIPTAGDFCDVQNQILAHIIHCYCLRDMFSMVPEIGERHLTVVTVKYSTDSFNTYQ